MASRRDLLQSFQFAARRVVSAVVLRQTDPREWPFRRLGGAGLATVMLTVVGLAAAGIYGVIAPGGKTSWQDGRTVIVDKRTGAPFVFVDGVLHPALNFASAALVAGTTSVTRTAAQSLAQVPQGAEVGILGAPATVPLPSQLVAPPWSLCSQQVPDGSGVPVSQTQLVVGRAAGRGTRLGAAGLLVRDTADQRRYLIWRDRRFPLVNKAVDQIALRLNSQVEVPVGDAWLKALPAGRPIGPQRQRAAGRPSTALAAVPPAVVGQVLRVVTADRGAQYYLVLPAALRPISELQAQIEQAAGATLRSLDASVVARARVLDPAPVTPADPPTAVPDYARPGRADTVVCATYQDGSFAPQVLVDADMPATGGVSTTGTGPDGAVYADRVWVQPGRAALVRSLSSPQLTAGPVHLVTSAGRRYPVPSEAALRALGLSGAPIWSLPSSLVVRVPEGPALDPDAARAAMANQQ